MYQRKALYHLRHIPSPWLFLSSNKSSFQDREKLGPSALSIVPTSGITQGAGGRGKCSAWQMIQHQVFDPLKNNISGLVFPQTVESLPVSCPSVLHFQHPGSLLSSGSFVSSEAQLGEQCVNGLFIIWFGWLHLWGWVPEAKGRSSCWGSGDLFGPLESVFIGKHVNVQI